MFWSVSFKLTLLLSLPFIALQSSCSRDDSGDKVTVVSDEQAVESDLDEAVSRIVQRFGFDARFVEEDLALLTVGPHGSTIRWTSDQPSLLQIKGETGVVTRPKEGEKNPEVTLLATAERNEIKRSRTILLSIMPLPTSDDEKLNQAQKSLTIESLLGEAQSNLAPTSIVANLQLPTQGVNGVNITWTSSHPRIIGQEGVVTRPTYSEGDAKVTLTATLSLTASSQTLSKSFDFVVLAKASTSAEELNEVHQRLTWDVIKGDNSYPSEVAKKLTLLSELPGYSKVRIEWQADPSSIMTNDGSIVRREYDFQTVVLTATLRAEGAEPLTRPFQLTIMPQDVSDDLAYEIDRRRLTFEAFRGDNASPDAVKTDLDFNATFQRLIYHEVALGPIYGSTCENHKPWQLDNFDDVITGSYLKYSGIVTPQSRDCTFEVWFQIKRKGSHSAAQSIKSVSAGRITVKARNMEASAIARADLDDINWKSIAGRNKDPQKVYTDLTLPGRGVRGTQIKWSVKPSHVIRIQNGNGLVKRPKADTSVVLEAAVFPSAEAAPVIKRFPLTVLAGGTSHLSDEESVAADAEWLNPSIIADPKTLYVSGNLFDDYYVLSSVGFDLNLVLSAPSGSTIWWSMKKVVFEQSQDWIDGNGKLLPIDASSTKRLLPVSYTATIKKGQSSKQVSFRVSRASLDPQKACEQTKAALDQKKLFSESQVLTQGISLDFNPVAGCQLRWSVPAAQEWLLIEGKTLKINRPELREGDQSLTLKADFCYTATECLPDGKEFPVRILVEDLPLSSKLESAAWSLSDSLILASNTNAMDVRSNLNLLKQFTVSGVTYELEWVSSDPAIISSEGVVKPPMDQGKTVILEARVTRNGANIDSKIRYFPVFVSRR